MLGWTHDHAPTRGCHDMQAGQLRPLPFSPTRSFPMKQSISSVPNAPWPAKTAANTRSFHVVVEQQELIYRDHPPQLTDQSGLIYRVTKEKRPNENTWRPIPATDQIEPLVLRCRAGEWIELVLENSLLLPVKSEDHTPQVPADILPDERQVSSCVSMHVDLVVYDVKTSDGATVGFNPQQHVAPDKTRTYWWFSGKRINVTGDPCPSPEPEDEPLGPVLLQDMADVRNHRHHGLVGALIIERADVTPYRVQAQQSTSDPLPTDASEAWTGTRATLRRQNSADVVEEIVLILQDGLRLYEYGDQQRPFRDGSWLPQPADVDHEDQGSKAFNYRTEPIEYGLARARDILGMADPATPTWVVPVGSNVAMHLIGGCDKPRNHSFTIHGVTWKQWKFLTHSPHVASESGITAGTVRTFEFSPPFVGDYAYRSGVIRWAVHEGLWGIIRVV